MDFPDQPLLLSCPFCGSADIDHVAITHFDDEGEGDAAGCNQCGASGPYINYDDKSEDATATDLWNRRAASALVDTPVDMQWIDDILRTRLALDEYRRIRPMIAALAAHRKGK